MVHSFIDESLDVASQATRIAEALGRYTNGLFVVQPCIQRLVRRVAHIDAEVASISNDLQVCFCWGGIMLCGMC